MPVTFKDALPKEQAAPQIVGRGSLLELLPAAGHTVSYAWHFDTDPLRWSSMWRTCSQQLHQGVPTVDGSC